MITLFKKALPFIVVIFVGYSVWIVFNIISNPAPDPASTVQTTTVSNDTIITAAHLILQKHNILTKKSNLVIETISYIDDRWLTAEITISSEPIDSEARTMIYVFKRDDQTVHPVAFSGDNFSRSSFPEPVSDNFIQRINTR